MANSSRNKRPPDVHRGMLDVEVPDFTPLIRSAVEVTGLRPVLSGPMTADAKWLLLYLFTPIRWRLHPVFRGGPGPWTTHPAGTALLVAPHIRYEIDTRPGGANSHHAWMHIEGLQSTPLYPLTNPNGPVTLFSDPSGALGRRMQEMIAAADAARPRPFWTLQVQGKLTLTCWPPPPSPNASFPARWPSKQTRSPPGSSPISNSSWASGCAWPTLRGPCT